MSINSIEGRFELRQSCLGSVRRIARFSSIEEVYPWFCGLHMSLRELEVENGVDHKFNDVQSFLVWDYKENHVAYHDGKYLTTYLLK